MSPEQRRLREAADWISRHATVLTIIAIAALVLIPTGIAWRASESASTAGTEAKRAVHRIQRERSTRIYEQDTTNHYICGRLDTLENGLGLLVGVSLAIKTPQEVGELPAKQLEAREVFQEVFDELDEAAECEVLIPPPPAHLQGHLPRVK